ncbi:MAG TPA: cytochrome c [Vicinamibacterales bacterium]|nr:cytochrome c [Vicinamibacterales bacterium]
MHARVAAIVVAGVVSASAVLWMPVQAAGQYAPRKQPENVPTFSRDVAPIFYKNCTGCHRPGEIAPMSLLTYKDARPWYRAIRENVEDGVMPPWHADPRHGRFVNDRSLSPGERDTIVRWARGGAPEGDPRDLPPQPTYQDGWNIGAPDLVAAMPEAYTVPAEGFVEYEYIEVPTGLTEDRWIQAMEVRPGNRAVVHHVIVYARSPQPERRPTGFRPADGMDIPAGQTGGPREGERKRARGISRFPPPERIGTAIGGFAPGSSTLSFPDGAAMLLRAGTTLVLQMHYTTSGKEESDQTKLGFVFARERPTREMRFAAMSNGNFVIPAGAADHSVTAEMTATADVTLRQLLPHTHLRGKSWEYTAIYPDGRSEVVLSVPRYDFNWQTDYVFAEPLKLPAGSKIRAVAHYDNSAANPANPDPTVDVRWGDQTWEEMMFTAFVYSIDGVAPGTVLTTPAGSRGR